MGNRVTFKIKDQDFHLMTKSSIYSKTFLLYNYGKIIDLEHCLGQKINVVYITNIHIGLRKFWILDLENVIYTFAYNFANEPEARFYNIIMYLYNKNRGHS